MKINHYTFSVVYTLYNYKAGIFTPIESYNRLDDIRLKAQKETNIKSEIDFKASSFPYMSFDWLQKGIKKQLTKSNMSLFNEMLDEISSLYIECEVSI